MRIHAHSVFVRLRVVPSFESWLPVTAIHELIYDMPLSMLLPILASSGLLSFPTRENRTISRNRGKRAAPQKKIGGEVEGSQAVMYNI